MSHNERLTEYINFINLSAREFALKAGIEYNKFNKYLNVKIKNPGADVIIAVLSTYKDLNARWWLCGEGDMIQEEMVSKKTIDEIEATIMGYLEDTNEAQKSAMKALKDHNAALQLIDKLEKRVGELEKENEELRDN